MPSINIKTTAANATAKAKSQIGGAPDSALKQAFDRFLNTPSIGSWSQFQQQLSAYGPSVAFNTASPEDRYAANEYKAMKSMLAGSKTRKQKLPANYLAYQYQAMEELGGNISLNNGYRATVNIPSVNAMSSLLGQDIGRRNISMLPQSILNTLQNQSLWIKKMAQTAPQMFERRAGAEMTLYSGDAGKQLAVIADILSKQYDLEKYVAASSGQNPRLGSPNAVALGGQYTAFREVNTPRLGVGPRGIAPYVVAGSSNSFGVTLGGIYAPFREVKTPKLGAGPPPLMIGYEGSVAMEGQYTAFREVNTRRLGMSGWRGYTQGAIGGAGAPWMSGYTYSGGQHPWNFNGGVPPIPPFPGGPGGPGGPNGGIINFGGTPGWLSSLIGGAGKVAGYAGLALAGERFLFNQAKPDFEYIKNMYALSRAAGGGMAEGQAGVDRFFPLNSWMTTYGAGPLEVSRMLRRFPLTTSASKQDGVAMGLAKAPFLPGFSHIDQDAVRSHLGYLASAFPQGQWSNPLSAGASLAPILQGAGNGGLAQGGLLDASKSIIDMQIAAGGIALDPQSILERIVNTASLNTPGARLGITQQNIVALQNQAVENIGSTPLQTFASMKVLQDMKTFGIQNVLGSKYSLLADNKVGAHMIDTMNAALASGNTAEAMGLLPSFLNAAGSQNLLTGAGASIAEKMFPGASNQGWRDLFGANLAGMPGTGLTSYLTNQLTPNGTMPQFRLGDNSDKLMASLGLDAGTQALVAKYSKDYGVDPALVLAIMKNESNFNPKSLSGAGAMGLMQVMPGSEAGYSKSDLSSNAGNIRAGISRLLNYYTGPAGQDLSVALGMYNTGPEGYKTNKAIGDKYASGVIATFRDYQKFEGQYATPDGLPTKVLQAEAMQSELDLEVSAILGEAAQFLGQAAANLLKVGAIMQQRVPGASMQSNGIKYAIPSNSPYRGDGR